MTLGEAKSEVLKLLDETKPKADLTGKLDRFFDMGQKEVALYYPIWREKRTRRRMKKRCRRTAVNRAT